MTLCTHCKLTTYLFHCIFRGRSLHIPPFRLNSRHCVSSAHWTRHSFLRWRCSPQRICLAKGKHSKRFTIDSFFSIQIQDSFTFKVYIICEGQKIWRDLNYTVPKAISVEDVAWQNSMRLFLQDDFHVFFGWIEN